MAMTCWRRKKAMLGRASTQPDVSDVGGPTFLRGSLVCSAARKTARDSFSSRCEAPYPRRTWTCKAQKKHAVVWLGFTRDARVRNMWREGPGELTLKVRILTGELVILPTFEVGTKNQISHSPASCPHSIMTGGVTILKRGCELMPK